MRYSPCKKKSRMKTSFQHFLSFKVWATTHLDMCWPWHKLHAVSYFFHIFCWFKTFPFKCTVHLFRKEIYSLARWSILDVKNELALHCLFYIFETTVHYFVESSNSNWADVKWKYIIDIFLLDEHSLSSVLRFCTLYELD